MASVSNYTKAAAGGLAGVTGAAILSPLEVVKSRKQSSLALITNSSREVVSQMPIAKCVRHISHTEGSRALFKGLSMTMVGVIPTRAIFFGAVDFGKSMFSIYLPPGTRGNNAAAAAFAGFVSLTVTNPIWLIKTRLQLDQSPASKSLSAWRCVRAIWRQSGPLGFYKGIQASYLGIAETALNFVVYEDLKRRLLRWSGVSASGVSPNDVVYCSVASTCSKTIATAVCYPHEVLRTRLREEGIKYRGLVQTFKLILAEEGPRAFYRGMLTHFMRQVPNTVIVFSTYEMLMSLLREQRPMPL